MGCPKLEVLVKHSFGCVISGIRFQPQALGSLYVSVYIYIHSMCIYIIYMYIFIIYIYIYTHTYIHTYI